MSIARTSLLLLSLTALGGGAVQAQTFTFNTTDSEISPGSANQGNYNDQAGHTPSSDNYVTGVLLNGSESRSFFSFNLAALNLSGKQVSSATLTVTRFADSQLPLGNTEMLALYDVSTPAANLKTTSGTNAAYFTDLGSGVGYGTFTVASSGSATDLLTFTLNAAALQNITSTVSASNHYFSVGGALQNASLGDYLFSGSTSGGNSVQRLTVTLAPSPEPSSLLVACAGALGTGLLAWRARRRTS